MKIAIIERLEKRKEKPPFDISYQISKDYIDIFEELSVLLIPIVSEQFLEEVCNMCDGLIVTGSRNNIRPKYYREEPEFEYNTFDEYPLVEKAVMLFHKAHKPILGICAGIQELNVIFGGTLKQRIENHNYKEEPNKTHRVKIERNSFLYKIYGKENIETNSFHSQALKEVATGFKIVAKSEDETIEGIENDNIIAVQWHLEVNKDIDFFRYFVVKIVNNKTHSFTK